MKVQSSPAQRNEAPEQPENLPETLYVRGVPLSYVDVGRGPAVILLHSAAASHRQWHDLIAKLSRHHRVLAPDLPGHGATPALPQRNRRTRGDYAAVVAALAELIGGPFHLVGHSYGAAIAMKLALQWQDRLLSLTLIEPSAFDLLRMEGEVEAWKEIEYVAQRTMALARLGDLQWCGDVFMGYWIGLDAWHAMPKKRRQAALATLPSVADTWPDIYDNSTPLAAYRNLTVPTLLVRGTQTTFAAHQVMELLRRTIPRQQWVEIEGAGHMAPLTHAKPVNDAIAAHLARYSPAAAQPAARVHEAAA